MSIFGILQPVKDLISLDKHKIDNVVFRLHSQVTVVILLTFSLVVTASQFIGDPIDCIVAKEVPEKMMDTYCWIHSTFTLPKRIIENDHGESAHPGVGTQGQEEEASTHRYYQWVCFTLFFQCLLFYVPRWLWLTWEDSKLKSAVPPELLYNVTDPKMPSFPTPRGLVAEKAIDDHIEKICRFFGGQRSLSIYKHYFLRFQFCEWLNLANVVFQILFVDIFLGGMFSTYGTMVMEMSNMDPEERTDPMSLVFPKVTKCTFMKAGPSGTVQNYDGLCVLPINIINEKIYIFMWFWFIFLVVVSSIFQVFRILTLTSSSIRSSALRSYAQFLVGGEVTARIVSQVGLGEWFFLCQMGANLDPHIFAHLLFELDKHLLTSTSRPVSNGKAAKMDKFEKCA